MAMASENSARGQPNSVEMGIWKTPKLARIAKPIIRTMQPPIRTGVSSGAGADCARVVMWRRFRVGALRSNQDF